MIYAKLITGACDWTCGSSLARFWPYLPTATHTNRRYWCKTGVMRSLIKIAALQWRNDRPQVTTESCGWLASAQKQSVPLLIGAVLLAPTSVRAEYRLAPGDVLEIGALGVHALQHRAMIGLDGQASFPLVGAVSAAGLTLPELRKQIKGSLASKAFRLRDTEAGARSAQGNDVITVSPDEVTVDVAEYRPVYLNGDVAKPGQQAFRPGMTVRQAIALAGGYDTMRFHSQDPFLQSSDFRADYNDLWTDFAKVQAQIARYRAELDGKNVLDPPSFDRLPLAPSVTKRILDIESQRFAVDAADFAKEKRYLSQAVSQEDGRISFLEEQEQTEQKDAAADRADYQDVMTNFRKGLLPTTRVSEVRRLVLSSASQALQTTTTMNDVKLRRADFARSLESLDDKRRQSLLEKLQEATVRLADIRSRLQSVSEKLLYAGVAQSQLVRSSGGDPEINIFRTDNETATTMVVNEQAGLMPGDVVNVSLRLDNLAGVGSQASSN
jgi:polysaccharide biosynthesis/export protein